MKKIDTRGFIYNVYDLGNGRVLKKEKPRFLQRLLHLFESHNAEYINLHKNRAKVLARTLSDRTIIGNPEYISEGHSYTQDIVTVCDQYLQSHTEEENKKIVDQYITSIFQHWKLGFSDLIFNWTRNSGVSKEGNVILIDFNEITFSKEDVAKKIEEGRWRKAFSYTRDLPEGPLKEYYADAMEKAMTAENLDRNWNDNTLLHE